MLSIVLGALVVAAVIVFAARQARERRVLAAQVHALREELQRLEEALRDRRSDVEAPRRGPGPVAQDHPPDAEARGSRTLH